MSRRFIVDTGPLVAFLSARDHHHAWARHAFDAVAPPLLTCEAVLAEAWHLLRGGTTGQTALLEMIALGVVLPEFRLKDEVDAVRRLCIRYRDRPTSLADASLVRMSELYDEATVITTGRDFTVYRRHGRQTIRVMAPFA